MSHSPPAGAQAFEELMRAILHRKKVVLLGVGNPDRGDDALGPVLAQRLGNSGSLQSLGCEDVPENFTGVVREAAPEVILLVDAVDFSGQPGEVVLLISQDFAEKRFNTHHSSLAVVMEFLERETKSPAWLLGVQPAQVVPGCAMSCEVDETINQLVRLLRNLADEDSL
jgi:hydrogenase 3 maturation protease